MISYDPDQDRWTLVQPMHEKRLGVGVVVINRLLYAIGGFNGSDRLTTVECYHPENNEWTLVHPMQYERSGAGKFPYIHLKYYTIVETKLVYVMAHNIEVYLIITVK